MTLGQRIAQHRSSLRLSQLELSEMLDVSRQSVSKWENDSSTPELEKLTALCKIFYISLDELVTGKEHEQVINAPPNERNTREIFGIIATIIGAIGFLLGFIMPIIWIICIPLLLFGTYILSPNVALVLGWIFLFIPLLFLRQFTGVTLWDIFHPNLHTHLIISLIIWALIILWTVCALRSKKFAGQKALAIGIGAILAVCPDWLSIPYWLGNFANISILPISGYFRMGISVLIPIVVIILAIRAKKSLT